MSLDSANFPLVWMRRNGRDTQAELAAFSALLARAEPFVILSDRRVGDAGEEPDRDQRTQVALWKRDNREALKLWVKGMIMLEPDAAQCAAAEAFAEYAAKFWGYPVLVAADEARARLLAVTLLSE
ncbi:hypothetical protein [Serratia entomophila]|jgi:hypothetical protein|uniref:VapC45 PIN like domain-containing protein n=1 Tax=Serratia entomophila TaxID=42906 RepID=A0ABY5CVI5_9GAMM|nr:hypothetical protein [Serratia entomophila]USV01493.1 hypothetical protein KFQ06_02850 [Serratia entomophila]CAI0775307.1 Uncharacterised protein [Serratia entomophila]CAI0776266.1 Uncharacterised protein [Serratia entomophila]CAI0822187.1 Uncharacterised protein [Serratia entomophila]CAI0822271.1 Uncharacterised protein [Serratia entomophila]